jgi:hypothetical protein
MKKHILFGEETYNLAPFEFEWDNGPAQSS